MPMVIALYLVLPAIQAFLFIQTQVALGPADILNFALAIGAYHWILSNILISTKLPFLFKGVPYDWRVRLHIWGSMGVVLAVAFHAGYKLTIGMSISPVTWVLLATLVILVSVSLLWIPVTGFITLRKRLLAAFRGKKELPYDGVKTLHGVLILTIAALAFMHILESSMFADLPLYSTALYGFLLFAAVFFYILSRTGVSRREAEVEGIDVQGEILVLTLTSMHEFRYQAGQFAFLRTRNTSAGGRIESHPFSFLSIPGEPAFRFAIRTNGDFTKQLTSLPLHTKVQVNGPYGNFRPLGQMRLCFIGSGIGTVPLISIIKDLHSKGDIRPIDAFFAVNRREEIPELERILGIEEEMPNLKLRILEYAVDGALYNTDYFRRELSDIPELSFWLCSSPNVRKVVTKSLKELGVHRNKIHFEAFSFG